ncbi:hypothetical protein ACR77J_12320 [Tissierella praeacuta]|uniref:hypothetical protein n=1 Tax=Tissierella praeacuta TaxID=43131 RepID=UPI003DA30550
MKNYQISSGQIPHLVRLTADLFREMNQEVTGIGATRYVPSHMHFMADLLKDLVETAYPMENNNIENEIDIGNLIKVAEFQSFDEMMEAIAEMTKGTKLSRKDGF